MRRGEVWTVELAPRSGSEQRGRRPAIVVSHDSLNEVEAWRSLVVIPVSTSVRQAKRHATIAPIRAGEGGLSQDSVALCHQVTTLDRGKFIMRLGILTAETLAEVERALLGTLDLRSSVA